MTDAGVVVPALLVVVGVLVNARAVLPERRRPAAERRRRP